MDFDFGERADALRAELRALIAAEIPPDFLGAFTDDPRDLEIAQRFCKRLAQEHLLTLAWPEEYGGRGASVWEQTVVREEMWAHHEPRGAQYMGVNWVGPAIMAFGTDAQKGRHLGAISAGDVIWCQGFSEPDAGSDLASLATRAEAVEGGWQINGQKIWTSYAGMAQWCVLAARVRPEQDATPASKHEGITLFLVPMSTPGITVRPIHSSLGPHHLNEVFFDNVVVDDDAVLGGVGKGWQVMRHALSFERVGIARYARCDRLLSALEAELGDRFDSLPAAVRAAWTRALVAVRVARLLNYRAVKLQAEGVAADTAASAARIAVTQADQLVAEALFHALDATSVRDKHSGAPLHGAVEDHYRYAQAATVASGTIEIQRMIVGRAALGRAGSVPERQAGSVPERQGRLRARTAGPVMDTELPEEVAELAATARRAFADAGGVDLARRAEADPRVRQEAADVLAALGAFDLDPFGSVDEMLAGFALCREAGRVVLPSPLAARLCRVGGRPLVLVDRADPLVDHGDVLDEAGGMVAADLAGGTYDATVVGGALGARLAPFMVPITLTAREADDGTPSAVALAHTLAGAWLLGIVEAAVDRCVDHVTARHQFGQRIADFQSVQFQVADAVVATGGLAELALYTVWRVTELGAGAHTDALALRLHAADVTRTTLRAAQQLHGASGVAEEYDISVLCRRAQAAVRSPASPERIVDALTAAVRDTGFAALFPHGRPEARRNGGSAA